MQDTWSMKISLLHAGTDLARNLHSQFSCDSDDLDLD